MVSYSDSGGLLNIRHSGVMRITVTVVVIMFELTGALTYILPTMVSGGDLCVRHTTDV